MNIFKTFLIISLTSVFMFSACDTDELHDLNINPTAANDIDPGFILAYTQLQLSGERYENWRAVLIYQSTMMQHFATLPGYWAGDKYTYIGSYSASLWDRGWRGYIKDLVNLVDITADDPEYVNYNSIARIWKVYAFARMTDLYGDIPYFEAGRGFLDTNFKPVYDSQQDIYTDMLNELSEAVAALDASASDPGVQDLIYGGDVDKWAKFGNSLRLRLGMRISNVDAGAAQSAVSAALSGGVMASNDDICYISHTDGPGGINMNGIGQVFNWDGSRYTTDDSPRLSEFMVDWMTSTGDPRLDKMSWRVGVDGNGGAPKGMPNGFDATTIQNHASWATDPDPDDSFTEMDDYSRIDPLYVLRDSPMLFMTYAEVLFLTAEAVEKGWATGDAAQLYADGVTAAMKQSSLYDASLAIDDADITTYLTANPYSSANYEEILGEQMWVATFLNEYETFANWRRTGFPTLTPVDYPGNVTGGTIPRRLRYAEGELSGNAENYEAAIARQGPDEFTTRVWWDVN